MLTRILKHPKIQNKTDGYSFLVVGVEATRPFMHSLLLKREVITYSMYPILMAVLLV